MTHSDWDIGIILKARDEMRQILAEAATAMHRTISGVIFCPTCQPHRVPDEFRLFQNEVPQQGPDHYGSRFPNGRTVVSIQLDGVELYTANTEFESMAGPNGWTLGLVRRHGRRLVQCPRYCGDLLYRLRRGWVSVVTCQDDPQP